MKQIFSVFCAVLALSQVTGTLADRPATYPRLLSEWAASAPPPNNSPEAGQANGSSANWFVFMRQGQPSVTLHVVRTGMDDFRFRNTRALPFKIKPSRDFSGVKLAARVDDGWVVGFNRGEWGGSLWWFSADGSKHYKISDDEVDQLLRTDIGVIGLKTLLYILPEHPDPKTGEVLRLVKSTQGIWQAVNYTYLSGAPEVAMQDTDGSLVIVTSHELLRVDRQKHMEALLTDGFWGKLQLSVTSIVRAASGDYFVGMRGGVTHIRRSGGGYRVDWLQLTKTFVRDNPDLSRSPSSS